MCFSLVFILQLGFHICTFLLCKKLFMYVVLTFMLEEKHYINWSTNTHSVEPVNFFAVARYYYAIIAIVVYADYSNNDTSSTCLMAIFQNNPGKLVPDCHHSGLYWSNDDGSYADNWSGAIRSAQLQSNRHHQNYNTQLFTGKMPFLSPNETTEASTYNTESDVHFSWLAYCWHVRWCKCKYNC